MARQTTTPPADDAPSDDLFDRYLRLLGVTRRRPSSEALREITLAHLTRVPFENLSKLLVRAQPARHGLPVLESFLDGIERSHLGGTCYANNFHFNRLLAHLGYRVTLCGADMSAPDVHLVNLVSLAGRPYLVDGGYGAPFLQPMPLDLACDQAIPWARDRYVLKPRDSNGRSRIEHYRDGRLRHGYLVNPTPRAIGEFARVIADSFRAEAMFMNALLVTRFFATRSVTLRNLTLTDATPTSWRSRDVSRRELPLVIEQELGIPRTIASQALDGVELTQEG